mgnify:FL=1
MDIELVGLICLLLPMAISILLYAWALVAYNYKQKVIVDRALRGFHFVDDGMEIDDCGGESLFNSAMFLSDVD